MTSQEAFDRVWEWFVVGGHGPSAIPGVIESSLPQCRYRADGGCRCAIGVLIPDELYDPAMEGYGVLDLKRSYPAIAALLSGVPGDLLTAMQAAHDQSVFRSEGDRAKFATLIRQRLRTVAERFGLTVPATEREEVAA